MPTSSKPRLRQVALMQRPPSARQVCATFAPIFGFLAALRTGEIWCTDAGAAIMPVWGGELCEAGPALEGWIGCWPRRSSGLGPGLRMHAAQRRSELTARLFAQVSSTAGLARRLLRREK